MRFLILLLLLSGACWANPRVLLLTPGLQTGTLEGQTFLQVLEHAVEKRARVNLVRPHGEDPRLQGLSLDQTPTPEQAQAAAERFQADYVVTLGLRFEHKVEGTILTVVGVALVTVDNRTARSRSVTDPVVFHSSPSHEPLERQTQELTVKCARDLAETIVAHARLQERASTRSPITSR